jgi:PKD repeat protein
MVLVLLLLSVILCLYDPVPAFALDPLFDARVDYLAGSHPRSVFCVDLDRDTDLDLAVANALSDNVSILINNGDGTFQSTINYGVGDSPRSVFCADLDGDTYLDVAVANDSSDNVSILINKGDGTYQSAVNYGVGDGPGSVFCADLDGDTDLDLAVANEYSGSVSILKNNGDGTYQSATNYGAGNHPWSVFCADLDGDKDLDVAVANASSGNVSILKNNGNGTYQSAVNYGVGDGPRSVFCADLDGDTELDLAVANGESGNVSILINNGNGAYQSAVNYAVGDGPRSVFCTDLDGDTDLDIAVANDSSDDVSILKNNGDGTYQSAVNYGGGDGPRSVFCADLDGDTDLDLAVANALSGNVSILKNKGDGTYQSAVNYEAGNYPRSVFCADLDGDIDLDLAVANALSSDVSILKNSGDGTYQSAVNYGAGDHPHSVFCADLDGDIDLDLAVANGESGNVSILKNNGDGTYQSAVNYGAGNNPVSVFCADLDGDIDLDLAVANYINSVSIFKNNGDGTYQSPTNYGVGNFPRSIFCADLDGDTDLDLAVANALSSNVSILKNNGDGTYQSAVNYRVGNYPRSVFCADLDGDTDLDLAVANGESGNVSILKNNGDGTYQSAVDYGAGNNPVSVFCADLDGDTDLELAMANEYSDNVSILINNGDGTFQSAINLGAGNNPVSVFCSDLDGDIDLDLAVANYHGNNVSILKNLISSQVVADFSAEPTYGSAPLAVQFTDLSIGSPALWSWDFGDGSTSIEQHLTYIYTDTGYFDVKLVVSNPQDIDSIIKEDYLHVLPSIPFLFWADNLGYITDGVSPDTSLEDALFTFRAVYSDANNSPPPSGYPRLNFDLNGDGDFEDENEGSFAMGAVDVDDNYVDGREYLYNTNLPISSNCQYSFSAKNSYGQDATGEPVSLRAGPVILDPSVALDLFVHSSDITFSASNPDIGEFFAVFATVHNNSDSNLTDISITFYHSGELLDQVLLSNVPSHGSATASIQCSFDVEGFYPIRVVVDEENSIEEWNELNNFAMRPVIVGEYEFPEEIVVQAQLNSPVYPYSWITVTGNTGYIPEYLGMVSGATVTITIQETGANYTSHADDLGNFSTGFYGPSEPGSYSAVVKVTDCVLTDSTILNLDVLPQPPGADLAIKINLSQADCLSENQEETVRAKTFNLGDRDAQDFWTCIYKDGSVYQCFWVDHLAAGDSSEMDTVISFSSIGSHNLTGKVDVGDSVLEYNEGNNISTVSGYVSCDGPDITVINAVFSDYTPKGEQLVDITAWLVNWGAAAVGETFGVEFSDNGIPFDTQHVTSLAPCGTQAVSVVSSNLVYSDTMSHSFGIFADFENVIAECNEENNIYSAAFSVFPDLWLRNIQISQDCFTWGDSLWFTVDIYNVGGETAENVGLRYLLDEVQFCPDILIDSVPSGASNYKTMISEEPWIVPEQLDVAHVCRVVVDPNDEIPEIRKDNNELTLTTPVVPCGDVNGDCLVGLGDVILLLNYLFKGGDDPFPYLAADMDSDQAVNLSDAIYLLNYLFRGGSPPNC